MLRQLEDLKKIHEGKGDEKEEEDSPIEVQGEEVKGEEEVPKALESPEEERGEEKKASSDLFSSFDEPPPR